MHRDGGVKTLCREQNRTEKESGEHDENNGFPINTRIIKVEQTKNYACDDERSTPAH